MMVAGVDIEEKSLMEVCRRYGVTRLALFGSQATGKATPGSDVDLLVDFSVQARDRISLLEFCELELELEALVRQKVDLTDEVALASGHEDFRRSVEAERVVLYVS